MRLVAALVVASGVAGGLAVAPTSVAHALPSKPSPAGIWTSPAELDVLPTTGPAWERLVDAAGSDLSGGVLTNRDDHNVRTLAAALVGARLESTAHKLKVRYALAGVMAAPYDSEDVLGAARRLGTYVVAADIVNLGALDAAFDTTFRTWVRSVLAHSFAGGGGGGTIAEVHERRPNNFGTHAAFSRIAAARYLGDSAELARAAQVFRGWLGDREAHAGFNYGSPSWQADPAHPVGINPAGATIAGRDVSGVLPDDQRRAGDFAWPPPCENYVAGALQGAVAAAELLTRAGYPAFEWEDRALLRAAAWLHAHPAGCGFTGDDEWVAWVVNGAYASTFPAVAVAGAGKNMGWTAWTHATPTSALQVARGRFVDDDGSPHEPAIDALADAGVASGCDMPARRFCPSSPLTRGQMATLLAGVLGLPPAPADHFVDDAGNVHEPAINQLAEAGVTRGTSRSRFSPSSPVTRAQIASLLAAALELQAPAPDRFTDDGGSVHEASIDVLAAAGVVAGCSPDGRRFCPGLALRRDQMASMLHAIIRSAEAARGP